MNILVLCTGNSARSILLESLLNKLGGGQITAYSAGSRPAGRVHPEAIALLQAEGFDTVGLRSKSWDEFGAADAPQMDLVVTVCGSAAGEECPIRPGEPMRAHWGMDDPAAGPGPEQRAAFQTAFAILSRKATRFIDQSPATLSGSELQCVANLIGDVN